MGLSEPATSPDLRDKHARAEWCRRVDDMLSGAAPRDEASILNHAMALAREIAHRQQQKYRWIDAEDMQQELLMPLPGWLKRYDPTHKSATTWSKYLYWKMALYAKDLLRREDPLGIKWPQRKQYPSWHRLSAGGGMEESLCGSSGQGLDYAADGLESRHSGEAIEADAEQVDLDREWDSDLQALAMMADENRARPRPPGPPLLDAGGGVLRQRRPPGWNMEKHRLRRRGATLRAWVRGSRPEFRKNQRKREAQMANETDRKILDVLKQAGTDGATADDIAALTDVSKRLVQAATARLRRRRVVYLIGQRVNPTGRKADVYGLVELFPAGPPVEQRKLKRPTKSRKKAPADGASKPAAVPGKQTAPQSIGSTNGRHVDELNKADVLAVVQTALRIDSGALKNRLLACLVDSLK